MSRWRVARGLRGAAAASPRRLSTGVPKRFNTKQITRFNTTQTASISIASRVPYLQHATGVPRPPPAIRCRRVWTGEGGGGESGVRAHMPDSYAGPLCRTPARPTPRQAQSDRGRVPTRVAGSLPPPSPTGVGSRHASPGLGAPGRAGSRPGSRASRCRGGRSWSDKAPGRRETPTRHH